MQTEHMLYDSGRTRVLRCRDGLESVVVKRLRAAWPTAEALNRLQREHDLLALVDGNGAPRALRVELDPPQLVTEDVDGISLGAWLAGPSPENDKLTVALAIAGALAQVHACGVLHRDLNPSNIVVHETTLAAWLIDFDLASQVAHRGGGARPMASLEGTPPYLSPEQTGRMNRAVDARSDLYGLGVTFYQLFSGRRPFECADVIGYAHAHLALEPPPLDSSVPEALRELITTLLEKRPEDRYQSAAGVVADLNRIAAGDAELIGRAVSDRPEIPQDLYGRESELLALRDAYAEAAEGGRGIVLIYGAAGIGKTSLVRELHQPVTIDGGRLLEGKFGQFTRDVPYTALAQILTAFVADALSESTEVLERWRRRVIEATAPNTRLLIDLAPRLEILVGAQPDVVDLSPTEAQSRLQDTVRRVMGAIATQDTPLVLFVDDLQWADPPSLHVLEALLRDPEMGHLLLIGAWRDTEVADTHALRPTLDALTSTGASVTRLALGALDRSDVHAIVAATLQREDVGELSAVIYGKTAGNPFFLRRFLEEATASMHYDIATLRWEWDADAIARLAVADNVVELLRDGLDRLSGDSRTCIARAALIGDPFDMMSLSIASGLDDDALRASVDDAIRSQFLRPLDSDYWMGQTASNGFRFAFVHDRVQEAARALNTPAEQAQVHLDLARSLASATEDEPLFKAAEHYRLAASLVAESEERLAVVVLHTKAAERALRCAAHRPAHDFAEAALAVADPSVFEVMPGLHRRLRRLAARAAWLVGRADLLASHVGVLHAEAGDDLVERLSASEILLQAMTARGDLKAVLDTALGGLADAGLTLPRKPKSSDVMTAIGQTLQVANDVDVEALPTLENDPLEVARRRILVRISSAAYVAEPNLLPLIACALVRRSITSGVSKESSYGFGVFALSLSAGWMLEAGGLQGRNSLALLERFPDRVLDGNVRHLVNHFVRVWHEPLRGIYDESPGVWRSLMDVGDLEYAGWVLVLRINNGCFSGVPLSELAEEIDFAVSTMELHGLDAPLNCILQFRQLVRCLRGQTDDPTKLVGADYDESTHMEGLRDIDFRAAVLALAVCQLSVRCAFGSAEAERAADTVMEFADGAAALFYQVPMRVHVAIARLDAGVDPEQVLALREPIEACALQCPANGRHLLAFFDAELARAKGELLSAILHYDEAIAGAAVGGFLQDQALAGERAARMHLQRGNERIALAYMREARFCWQRWGAEAKTAQLDAEFSDLVAPAEGSLSDSNSVSGAQLDLVSLLKASQAISEELELDALLTRAMGILLENVAARRGVLFLVARGELKMEAEVHIGGTVVLHRAAEPAGVPLPLVRRVWRSGEAELTEEPAALCAPVTHQGRQLGVLYFENDLSAGTFTVDRLKVIEVLAPQLAISVRNVRLQEAQSRFVPRQFLRSLDRDDIVDVRVGDHALKEVTVFFSDIWGFTPLVELLSAKDALGFINRYLSYAEPAIAGNQGFIDTYLGDAIMALFDGPENATNAVAAGIAMHQALDMFNVERSRAGLASVRTGLGLNTGTVTMGIIGGQSSVKCGVVGDAVNLAARVEGLTRRTESRLLISEATRARLRPGFQTRCAGRVTVKGRDAPLAIHEVLDAETPAVRDERLRTLPLYEPALQAYFDGDLAAAVEGFEAVLAVSPRDPQPLRFLEMAQALQTEGLPGDWDGIERLTTKK